MRKSGPNTFKNYVKNPFCGAIITNQLRLTKSREGVPHCIHTPLITNDKYLIMSKGHVNQ